MAFEQKDIILFDGECILCNRIVRFIVKRDKKNKFLFLSLQYPLVQKFLSEIGFQQEKESIVLLKRKQIFTESTAVLIILSELQGVYVLFNVFWIFPLFLRNHIYRIIANNRTKWFGKSISCSMPDKSSIKKLKEFENIYLGL